MKHKNILHNLLNYLNEAKLKLNKTLIYEITEIQRTNILRCRLRILFDHLTEQNGFNLYIESILQV